MAQQTIDDTTLVEALLDVFRDRGYEGATLSILSEVTGLKKSSLYHRFPAGKDDMVKAVVLYVSKLLHEEIIAPLLNTKVSVDKRFNNMIMSLMGFYSDGRKNCIFNVLNLADTKAEIKELLNNDYNDWLSAIIKIGKEIGLTHKEAVFRANHFLIIVECALVIQRVSSDATIFRKNIEHVKKQFLNNNV